MTRPGYFSSIVMTMTQFGSGPHEFRFRRSAAQTVAVFSLGAMTFACQSQTTPLISGGAGLITQTSGGDTTYVPTIAPVLELPLGSRLQIEAKANLLEAVFPRRGQGYDTSHYVALAYLQANMRATAHATVTAGYFYTPFNTFTERLSPIWINDFNDGPIISSIGIASPSGSALGGMVRGNLLDTGTMSFTYDVYFSGRSASEQFTSTRVAGDRVSFFLPKVGVEVGTSFNRVLQGAHSNNVGMHFWWTPPGSRFRFRSEYAHTPHVDGYWVEFASQLNGASDSTRWFLRFEPAFRLQQTLRRQFDAADGLPNTDVHRADFALNVRLPRELKINTSYSRRFAPTGNSNIWQTGLVYRFLFPAWKTQ